jgi:hypothetical protein
MQVTDLVTFAKVRVVVAYHQVLATLANIHLVVMVSFVVSALRVPSRLQEMKELVLHVKKASILVVIRLDVRFVIQML